MTARALRVETKAQLVSLVTKLNEFSKRCRLIEADPSASAPPAAAAATASAAPTAQPVSTPAANQQVPSANAKVADDQARPEDQDAQGVPTLKNIVDQLNTLRAGRSLKDADVKEQLERYFEGLEDSEKEAMHAYFKGVSQIVSGQVDASVAEEPKNHGVETQTTGKSSRTVKPNVIRSKKQPAKQPASAGMAAAQVAAKSPRENTTPPAPIVPKPR